MGNIDCKTVSRIFRALGSETGVKIVSVLARKKELCVSELADEIGLSMSAMSHQLQRMETLGLIESLRDGRTICYKLTDSLLSKDIIQCLKTAVAGK